MKYLIKFALLATPWALIILMFYIIRDLLPVFAVIGVLFLSWKLITYFSVLYEKQFPEDARKEIGKREFTERLNKHFTP
jgi:hypothetical protein